MNSERPDKSTWSRFDLSALMLVLSNLFTIWLAWREGWTLVTIMTLYWGQSVIIGLFTALRMVSLRQFSTEGIKVNDKPLKNTPSAKLHAAGFFLVHYGGFHAAYFGFIYAQNEALPEMGRQFIICQAAFFLNHLFSFIYNLPRDRERRPNLGRLMLFPYARIIPMHITIVCGAALVSSFAGILLFMGLKTVADVIMHIVEHYGSEEEPP